MDFRTQETQRALQNSVLMSAKSLGGEKIFTDAFAKACIDFGLNEHLPDGMRPIPIWDKADYATPNKRLFRVLGIKEPDTCKFNIEFVSVTIKALLKAMPRDIRLEFLNSQFTGLNVICVDEIAVGEGSLLEAQLKTLKEMGDAITETASFSPGKPKERAIKELSEAKEAIKRFISILKGDVKTS